jgi:heterodisulfide reductase subunit A-like polyferredoxin
LADREQAEWVLRIRCVWGCGVCGSVCREGSITYGSCDVRVDRASCSKCKICASACPAGILMEELFV